MGCVSVIWHHKTHEVYTKLQLHCGDFAGYSQTTTARGKNTVRGMLHKLRHLSLAPAQACKLQYTSWK